MEEYKSTITLKECVSVMRDMGISTSETTISLGIAQGVFPFGIAIGTEKSRVLMISKKLFTEWCETFCGRTPDFSPYMTKPQQYIYGYTLPLFLRYLLLSFGTPSPMTYKARQSQRNAPCAVLLQ